MPAPAKKAARGIVTSGSAGNGKAATKRAKAAAELAAESNEPPPPPPLFPVGYKTPLSLLNERCQNAGWKKVNISTKRLGSGWTGIAHITRTDPKTNESESVRMEPPSLDMETEIEAKHWTATYALFRIWNGLNIHLILPPGPRAYWSDLQKVKKEAPAHQEWMWDQDPFHAAKRVSQRREKAAEKMEGVAQQASVATSDMPSTSTSAGWKYCPEVVMAPILRQRLTDIISSEMRKYPDLDMGQSKDVEAEIPNVKAKLASMGFRQGHINSAVKHISNIRIMGDVTEAALDYLTIICPEEDLPKSMIDQNAGTDFISSASSSSQSQLVKSWLVQELTGMGYPRKHVVQAVSQTGVKGEALDILVSKLCNLRINTEAGSEDKDSVTFSSKCQDEIATLQAMIDPNFITCSTDEVSVKIRPSLKKTKDTLSFHWIVHARSRYPRKDQLHHPTFYLSGSLPAYIKMYLTKCLVSKMMDWVDLLESGDGGVVYSMIEWLEENWEDSAHHPPDLSDVMEHLSPRYMPNERASTGARASFPMKKHKLNKISQSSAQMLSELSAKMITREYGAMIELRNKLPAWNSRSEFIELMQNNRVVVAVGETGSGKTTQLPQFILDNEILAGRGFETNILVTQPRRVSAIGVSSRVAQERLEDLNSKLGLVGYAIRGERKSGPYTKLLFCTTGVVLRQLSNDPLLAGVSHVIVDEVHERSVDSDFLLLQLKELLKANKTIKIVLMSATIQFELFTEYFGNAPLFSIPGLTFPVTDFYLEDIIPKIKSYRPSNFSAPKVRRSLEELEALKSDFLNMGLSESEANTLQILSRSEKIDYELVAATVALICNSSPRDEGILIFLPGAGEFVCLQHLPNEYQLLMIPDRIKTCIDALKKLAIQAEILPLHANLSSDDQRKVFKDYSARKIIVATNIAETSITVTDIVHVIDAGKVKETQYHPEIGLTRLDERWTSRAAARQRRGRAGRVRPGNCYKLYTRDMEKHQMQAFGTPEILRTSLESLFLQIKATKDDEDCVSFLQKSLSPPRLASMESAWRTLQDVGAVSGNELTSRLTTLGKYLSVLPFDLRLGKMLLMASIFKCLDPILTVAAILSSKPLFSSPPNQRQDAQASRAKFASAGSDLLTDVKAYAAAAQLSKFAETRKFCEENFIVQSTVRDISAMRKDFLSNLEEMRFLPYRTNANSPELNINSCNENLLKSILVAGLWPQVVKVQSPKQMFEQVAAGTIAIDSSAKDYRIFDPTLGRVFLTPSNILFNNNNWESPFISYFSKFVIPGKTPDRSTDKISLRDANKVPLYALLLFGGEIKVNRSKGGLEMGAEGFIKMKSWPRIGLLVNQLRCLLDAELAESFEEPAVLSDRQSQVVQAMLELLSRDGLVPDHLTN